MNDAIMDKLTKTMAIDGANEWFDGVLRILTNQITEMQHYKERFNEAVAEDQQFGSPTAVLSWAVNNVMHMHGNMRIDMALHHATRLREAGIK